jgi:hypothetical protein
MRSYIKTGGGAVGYGVTEEEAMYDLKINQCKIDISNDESGSFMARRDILQPWLPKDNMLHITGKGCLHFKDNRIVNTKTGKGVECRRPYKPIFYYLAELFDSSMTYEDFVVVCRREIDEFFSNISLDILTIENMEPLKRLGAYTGFDPSVVYTLSNNLMLARTKSAIGLKSYGEELFLVQEGTNSLEALPYIGYRLGYHVMEGGIEECLES